MNDDKRASSHEGYEEDTANPGSPPSHATHPKTSGKADHPKTLTDPHTGEPSEGRPDTVAGG